MLLRADPAHRLERRAERERAAAADLVRDGADRRSGFEQQVGGERDPPAREELIGGSPTARGSAARVPHVTRPSRGPAVKAKTYTLKKVSKAITTGDKAKVTLKLSRGTRTAARRALRAGKHVTVKLKIVVVDAAGNARHLSRNVKLRR